MRKVLKGDKWVDEVNIPGLQCTTNRGKICNLWSNKRYATTTTCEMIYSKNAAINAEPWMKLNPGQDTMRLVLVCIVAERNGERKNIVNLEKARGHKYTSRPFVFKWHFFFRVHAFIYRRRVAALRWTVPFRKRKRSQMDTRCESRGIVAGPEITGRRYTRIKIHVESVWYGRPWCCHERHIQSDRNLHVDVFSCKSRDTTTSWMSLPSRFLLLINFPFGICRGRC